MNLHEHGYFLPKTKQFCRFLFFLLHWFKVGRGVNQSKSDDSRGWRSVLNNLCYRENLSNQVFKAFRLIFQSVSKGTKVSSKSTSSNPSTIFLLAITRPIGGDIPQHRDQL